jgi:hypothetical protein
VRKGQRSGGAFLNRQTNSSRGGAAPIHYRLQPGKTPGVSRRPLIQDMLSAEQLQRELPQFIGTTRWERHALASNMLMTDGILYLREKTRCDWLIDGIAFCVGFLPILQHKHYQVWTFDRKPDGSSRLYVTEGKSEKLLHDHHTDYASNFPLAKITLWAVWDDDFEAFILMLPSEGRHVER